MRRIYWERCSDCHWCECLSSLHACEVDCHPGQECTVIDNEEAS